MVDTLIVIPCFNEAERLDVAAIEEFFRKEDVSRFLFVDDGSTDATGSLLSALHERHPARCNVLTLPHNKGKAEAVRAGMLHGLHGTHTFIGYWDADLSTSLNEIARFRDCLIADADLEIVLGCRLQRLGANITRRRVRHYLGRAFATLASMALQLAVYDTQCGAKLLRVTPRTQALFSEPFTSRWVFDVELLSRLARQLRKEEGQSIETAALELPLASWRNVGTSKLKATHMVVAVVDLIRIARAHRRSN
jgi:glycosyltransferase involved in cell wall biosynthesis